MNARRDAAPRPDPAGRRSARRLTRERDASAESSPPVEPTPPETSEPDEPRSLYLRLRPARPSRFTSD
jgi:hypothetical protein